MCNPLCLDKVIKKYKFPDVAINGILLSGENFEATRPSGRISERIVLDLFKRLGNDINNETTLKNCDRCYFIVQKRQVSYLEIFFSVDKNKSGIKKAIRKRK